MFFIGYHGTSEASAQNILSVGVSERFLPPTGQIGRGFYIARMNGTLPQWGATQATAVARARQNVFVRIITMLTGEAYNPFLGDDARPAILKIHAIRPLVHCKWNIMNSSNLHALKITHYDNGGPGVDLMGDCQWLQMVVPPEEIPYLRASRDDGVAEAPTSWNLKESPF